MRLFQIPIIQPDLRHEEAILQSLNTLDYLNEVIGNIFDRIDKRIENNQSKVQDINRRIGIVNSKIESLKDSKKAVTIYSTNKYPEQEQDFTPIFGDESEKDFQKPVLKKLSENDIKSSPEKINHRKPQEKLQFYHVKATEKTDKAKRINKTIVINIPLNIIKSVDSLIVFKKDDKLEKSKSSSASSVPIEGRKLEAAPASITNKNQKKNLESIFYTPSAVDNAPQLDLPMDLPDLPGIAGDIAFNVDDDFMIVPSRARSDTVASLGISVTDSKDTFIAKVEPILVPSPSSSHSSENIEIKAIEITKPPAAPVAPRTEEYIIPPPPPPPAAPFQKPLLAINNVAKDTPPASNARLNLLADIRKAGGKAKLRPAAASDRQPISEKKKEKPPPTDDLMSDLRNRLQMRRKGISGAKENQPSDMMSKLSTMIPPPSMEQRSNKNNNDSDDDWN